MTSETHRHEWVGAYGQFWCRRCQAPLADAGIDVDEAGCPVAPEPPPTVGSLLDRALSGSAFDRIDQKHRGGGR